MVDLGPLPDTFPASIDDVPRRGRGLRGLLAAMGDGATAERDRFAPGERGRIWFDRYARARGLTPIDPAHARGRVPLPPALRGLGIRLDSVASSEAPEIPLPWRPRNGHRSDRGADEVRHGRSGGDGAVVGPTIAYISRLPLPYRLDPDRIGDTLVHVPGGVDPTWDLVIGHHDATRAVCAWPWRTRYRAVAMGDHVELLLPVELTDDTTHLDMATTLVPWIRASRGAVHVHGGDSWALAGRIAFTRDAFDRLWPLPFLTTDVLCRRPVPDPWFPAGRPGDPIEPTAVAASRVGAADRGFEPTDIDSGSDAYPSTDAETPTGAPALVPADATAETDPRVSADVLAGLDQVLLDWARQNNFDAYRHGAIPLDLDEPDDDSWRSLTPMLHGSVGGRTVAVTHEWLHRSYPDAGAPRAVESHATTWTSVFVHRTRERAPLRPGSMDPADTTPPGPPVSADDSMGTIIEVAAAPPGPDDSPVPRQPTSTSRQPGDLAPTPPQPLEPSATLRTTLEAIARETGGRITVAGHHLRLQVDGHTSDPTTLDRLVTAALTAAAIACPDSL